MNKFKRFYGSVKNKAAVAGGMALGLVGSAHAAIDTTVVTGGISDAQTAAVAVAGAVIALVVAVKAFRYMRSAL